MGKKIETYAVVDADYDKPFDVLKDVVDNWAGAADEADPIEEARKCLDALDSGVKDPNEDYHKIVKITIEEITTLDDAVAARAGA